MIGLSLLAPGCSQGGNPPGNAQNETAAAPAAVGATPAAMPVATGVGGRIAERRRTLITGAVSALQESYAALDLLSAGKADDAVQTLARASGKLDVVLAAEPKLALAPVDVRVTTRDLIATPADVKALRDLAEAALDDGRIQDARRLIAGLASESVVTTVNIPLASYPGAIKQAAARILAGHPAEAKAMLETALATLVVEDLIIPLPLARAEALLDLAQPLAEKAQRSADENKQLERLLADARLQIDLAKALGYATKQDLDALSDELETIDDKTRGEGSGMRLFDRIKALFVQANRQANTPPRP
ncbi:hypothetical protein ABIC65_000187 [Sphingomonas trueperi]|uniref:YfdX family protein n=1 Tax=Sphingomonas trueperi TaxID=53317 RepID=UPI0033967701